ncbi:DUF881 domain-containing protein [Georgenia sp. TF02-10]|uniref:DUF881 domain-containing protein n=1 Tax=Georgenia sp. TF02-10 TaxID=2917725 RepID=UPI001FA739B6|nr:DUF881 domain-containing protein [Georgenia sp. TF02-10]UNX53156.1 DUF881 domain-containing protein [Georgenia sp. TF02-10]
MTAPRTPDGAPAPDAGGPPAPGRKPDGAPRRATGGWRSLLVPRLTRTQVLVAVLCAVLGFGVVAQVRQVHGDALSGMRQDDLVRLLDELGTRNDELAAEQEALEADLAELRSASSSQEAARQAAAEQERVQGVLAGTLPVRGPGVVLTVADPDGAVSAQQLVTILEELRNAGAESVELSGQRLTASSWIVDGSGGVVVDGVTLAPPYRWTAVGDPRTLAVALDIPGGALATVRSAGATATVSEREELEITAVRTLTPPEHATVVPADDAG